jgi:MFS family permease
LFLGRVLWGLAWSLLWVGGNSVVLDISSAENRGKNSGIYQMWFIIGVAASSFLGAVLTDKFGFRSGQWISVAVIAATALIWFFFLPETRRKTDQLKGTQRKSPKQEKIRLPWKLLGLTSVTIFITRFLAWGVIAATAILWLSEIFGEGARIAAYFVPIATLTGLYTALSNLTGILSTPLAGSISDRIGRRWPVLGSAAILGGLGLWLMSGEIQIIALLGAFLVPVAGSTTETLIPAIAGDRVPENMRSRALGLINTAGDLGATLGPFAALGLIQAEWLSISGIYRIGGGLLLMIALLAFSPLVSNRKHNLNQV